MAGKYRLKGVYGKPLVKGTPLEDDPDRKDMLEETGKLAIQEIQNEIRRLTFKRPATNLLKSFTYRIEGQSTLIIESDHPAAKYLNRGVRRYQMRHLLKADRPIPLVMDDGTVKFRNATPKGMAEGKWVHPGIRGKNFLDKGLARAKAKIKEKVKEDIKNRIIQRMKGGPT